jgi:endo-1,4-beta-xylanase
VKYYIILILIASSISFFGQDVSILEKGEKWIDYSNLNVFNRTTEYGSVRVINDLKDEKAVFAFETSIQPNFIFNHSYKVPTLKRSSKEGDTFLVTFQARTIHSNIETGEARILFILKQSNDANNGYKFNVEATPSISKDWKTYYIPLTATKDSNEDEVKLIMQLGFPEQKFELTDFQVFVFPKGFDTSLLPQTKVTYKGMEPDAAWRIEANERIEKIRKTDFSITFKKKNKKIENQNVQLNLIKHQFHFGAAIEATQVVNQAKHLDFIVKNFNTIVFENDLKMKAWRNLSKQETTLKAIEILKEKGVKIKGHTLLWPGFRYLPDDFKKNENNPKKIEELTENFLLDILVKTNGSISHWDVTNENYSNRVLQEITGSNQLIYDAFTTTRMLDPKAERFINEYGIISSGGIDKIKQDWYYNYIKEIDQNTHNSIDGIGMQSHIGSDLTSPEIILSILDRFATLDKKISISEFTMDIPDPDIRRNYTRDFMLAAFSHPAVSEFLFWGYFEPKHPKAGLIDENFEWTEMGKAFDSLVNKEWKTSLNLTTDEKGTLYGNGFYGTYSYSVQIDQKWYSGTFNLDKGSKHYTIEID